MSSIDRSHPGTSDTARLRRVLGLPAEPRVDKDLPFSAVLAMVPVR